MTITGFGLGVTRDPTRNAGPLTINFQTLGESVVPTLYGPEAPPTVANPAPATYGPYTRTIAATSALLKIGAESSATRL